MNVLNTTGSIKIRRVLLLCACFILLAGCALRNPPPPVEARPVTRIMVLPVVPIKRLYNENAGIPFGLVLQAIADRVKSNNFTDGIEATRKSMAPALTSALVKELRERGFDAQVLEEVAQSPDFPDHLDYKQLPGSDPVLHVYFEDVGMYSSRFSINYIPRVNVTVNLVRPLEDEYVYAETLYYGAGSRGNASWSIPADPQYKWESFDALMQKPGEVGQAYEAAVAAIAAKIAVNLRAQAGAPQTAAQRQAASIERIDKVEIFYNPEEHVSIHDFGQNMRSGVIGLSGLMGPVGTIAGTAVALAASNAALDATFARSQALTAAAKPSGQDMNREFAQHLAQLLDVAGKTVKLTEVMRLPGLRPGLATQPLPMRSSTPVGGPSGASGGAVREMPTARPARGVNLTATNGYTATPGFTPLLLRVTTGFSESEALTSFKPVVVFEYAVVNTATGRYLSEGRLTAPNQAEEPTYLTCEQLLAGAGTARTHLRSVLMTTGEQVAPRVLGAGAGM